MDVTHLPLLPNDTRVETAFNAMRWLQRSAVIRKGNDLQLVCAGAIVLALAKNLTGFSNLESKSEVREVTSADVQHFGLDLNDPKQTPSNYNQFLDHYGTHYAVLDSVPGLALVVTRHEDETIALNNAPGGCYCEGPLTHKHPAPPTRIKCKCGHKILCYPPAP